MQKIINEIRQGVNVRANLIKVKEMLKSESPSNTGRGLSIVDEFLEVVDWDMDFFRELLHNEDPKVRKNILQIISLCELDGLTDDVFDAYQSEKTMFVRADYVKTLAAFDVKDYVPQLQKQLQSLQKKQEQGDIEKHVSAELRALYKLLGEYGKIRKHRFVGADTQSTMILTSLSGKEAYVKRAVDRQIGEGKTTLLRGGVKVVSSDYENIMKVRCFQEMLFVVPGCNRLTGSPKEMAEQMIKKELLPYLHERLFGSGAYRFRLDIRGMKDEDEKQKLVKKLAKELETASEHELVNAPDDYEIELRIHKSAKSQTPLYAMYLKLNACADERFAYRTHTLPTSIQPYVAALIMEMIDEETKSRGQVLDPFCGVGTMLMERNYHEHAHSLYGVDVYGQAIIWANEQAKKAHMDIHYIHKDMQDFSHKYLFDLIVTNLPAQSKTLDSKEVLSIYETFLGKCTEWLEKEGIVVVYSASPQIFDAAISNQSTLKLYKKFDMYKNNKSALYILK